MKKIAAAIVVLMLAGGGCLPASLNLPAAATPTRSAAPPSWAKLSDVVSRYECAAPFCASRLIIYKFAKDKFNWRLENSAAAATVENWDKQLGAKESFVMNGVYFDEKNLPTGLFMNKGKRAGAGEYDRDQSGLLVLTPEVKIFSSRNGAPETESLAEAAQNFPLLIKDGVAATTFKDERSARRTFIGTDADGNVYAGIVPERGMTFPALAKYLATLGVKWDNVLNLDGGTSTGFAAHVGNFSETMNSIVQVPNVIVAENK